MRTPNVFAADDLCAVLSAAGYRPYPVRGGRTVVVACLCGMQRHRIGPFCHDDHVMPESGKRRVLDELRGCFICGPERD